MDTRYTVLSFPGFVFFYWLQELFEPACPVPADSIVGNELMGEQQQYMKDYVFDNVMSVLLY